jgi:hypothetical protein
LTNPLAFKGEDSYISFGVSPKFVCEDYGSKWIYGFKLDMGVLFESSHRSGVRVGISRRNGVGGNLRAFPNESWLGFQAGGGKSLLTVMAQTRFDRPFDGGRMKRNFQVGMRLRSQQKNVPTFTAGVIQRHGSPLYSAGVSAQVGARTGYFDYAVVMNPDEKNAATHFVTYGFTMQNSRPSSPGTFSW